MTSPEQDQHKQEARNRKLSLARSFKVDFSAARNSDLVRSFLLGAIESALVIPVLFYLRFGVIDWFAIAFTTFMVVLCLLISLGFFLQTRTDYHTTVSLKSNLADKIGAFWLVACAFGPFFGWLVTAPTFLFTAGNWRWFFFARVFLSVVAPLITAIPLLRYARGKSALIALPLLIIITSLPVLTCLWVIGDLHDGARSGRFAIARDQRTGRMACVALDQASRTVPCDIEFSHTGSQVQVTWLPHSGRVIEVRKL